MAIIAGWYQQGREQEYPAEPCSVYSVGFARDNQEVVVLFRKDGQELQVRLTTEEVARLARFL